MPQLFDAYNKCEADPDGKFNRYIEQLKNGYSDGTVTLTSVDELMTKAEMKFNELAE